MRLRFALALALAAGSAPAFAQAPAAPAPAPDPALQKAQAAFEALPEAERRQIQLDLNFATEFSGAALGTFGPLTYRAIQTFERTNKSQVDGVLEPPERAALAAAARRERDRVGFRQVADGVTKASIGLPVTLLPRSEKVENPTGAGTRWQSADGKVTVATRMPPAAEGTLEQIYEKAQTSANPQRRVTYKLLRPDFYVIAGETPQGKFYQRMAKLPDGALRGFTISYDKALAPVWDKLTVAAANTFLPAGQPQAAAASAAPGAASRPAAPSPPDPLAPKAFERSLTALVVAPGRALTSAAPFKACPQPRLAGQPARLVAEDQESGLALIAADNLAAPALTASLKSGGDAAVVLAIGPTSEGQRGLLALPAERAGTSLSAALQAGAAGAPVFGGGGLAGIVISDPSARLQVAGVLISGRYRLADAAAIERLLKAQNLASPAGAESPASLGGLVGRHGRSVVGIACGP